MKRLWNKQRRCIRCGHQRHKAHMRVSRTISSRRIKGRKHDLPRRHWHNELECKECP